MLSNCSAALDEVGRAVNSPLSLLPLTQHASLQSVFAYQQGRPISVAQYLHDVHDCAQRLPACNHVVNACADRYRFAVGFGAALTRRQTTLLPANLAPEFVRSLLRDFADLYCLADSTLEQMALPQVLLQDAADAASVDNAMPVIAPDHVAAIAFTSGSTGAPLPQAKTWGSLVRSAWAELEALQLPAQAALTCVGTVPVQHMYGFESTLLIAMHNGLALHHERPFYPEDVRRCLEQVPAPRMLVTTPVHLRALLEEQVRLPPLELLLCATAPLDTTLAAQAEAAFGTQVCEIYGFTEAGQIASRRTVDGEEWRALPGTRLYQQDGVTFVAGGHVQRPTPLTDVVELRDEQHFRLLGRHSDLINIAGKRTSLAHLNLQLCSIPGVKDAVFYMPEEAHSGVTRLVAFAVAPGLNAQQILTALRKRIDAAFLPRPLYLVLALPRNLTGKLPREALRALAQELAGT